MKIVVPIDLTSLALNAFSYALQLAQQPEADIITLYIQPADSPDSPKQVGVGGANATASDPYKSYLQVLDALVKKEDRMVTRVTHVLRKGQVADEIAAFARSNQADCIVIGAGQSDPVEHRFFGFLAEQLMASSGCFVIAVPEQCGYRPITKIIMLAHLPKLGLHEVKRLQRFAEKFHAHVNVVELKDDFKEEDAALLNHWAERLYKAEVSFHILVCSEGEHLPAIIAYTDSNEASLIAVHVHDHKVADRVMGSSLATQLLEGAAIPLLGLTGTPLT